MQQLIGVLMMVLGALGHKHKLRVRHRKEDPEMEREMMKGQRQYEEF